MEEFCCDIDFKYGIPLIVLDLINALTGYEIIEEIKKQIVPPKHIERLNPDGAEFQNDKLGIDEDYQDLVFGVFNSLAELNLKKIQNDINDKIEKQIDESANDRDS